MSVLMKTRSCIRPRGRRRRRGEKEWLLYLSLG